MNTAGYAQAADSVAAEDPGDFVDLTGDAVIIKAEPDRPRVNIISDRIKPTFDTINLVKSFVPELVGVGERIVVLEKNFRREEDIIDVDKVVNRSR